jgi:hypothetical protein
MPPLITPPEWEQLLCQTRHPHVAFATIAMTRPPDLISFEATSRSRVLQPDDLLTLPERAWSAGFGLSVSLPSAAQATRGLARPSVGLTPTERIRVSLDARFCQMVCKSSGSDPSL